jgi:hypothetical protein
MTNHQNFLEFVKKEVIPAKKANPDHKRLDRQTSGGNRRVVGHFQHEERLWKVHSDTYYEPLMLAYKAAIDGIEPFVEDATQKGSASLRLKPEIKRLQTTKYKHLYIYEVKTVMK